MRVWLVHPQELDDQRLLAQHQEVHAIVRVILNAKARGHQVGGSAKEWAIRGDDGLTDLVWLHALCLVEMFQRWPNCNHQSPLTTDICERPLEAHYKCGQNPDWPPKHFQDWEVLCDVADLQARWEREGKLDWLKRSVEKYQCQPGGSTDSLITRFHTGSTTPEHLDVPRSGGIEWFNTTDEWRARAATWRERWERPQSWRKRSHET